MANHDLEETYAKIERRLKVYIMLLKDIKYKIKPHKKMFLKDILVIVTKKRKRSTIKHNCQKADRER